MPTQKQQGPRRQGSVQYDNSGRVVLVTGGGKGIGLGICEAFAASGAAVVCLDVDETCAADLPAGVVFQRGDVSRETDCQNAIDWTCRELGGLDVLVNNASIQPPESYKPLDEFPTELWQRMVGVNFTGYTLMAKYALRHMKQQGGGVIVNIASAQGHRTAREVAAYGPIKSGNIMQARQWGVEYARHGIRVVSVSPGGIDTPLLRASISEEGGEKELANRHPVGRIGIPSEVANAVLWLSSGDASFVTATDLEVDGGLGAFAAFAAPFNDAAPTDDDDA